MHPHIYYVFIALASYLIGTSNLAFYISKIKKISMRDGGSGNLGASNAMILMGWKAGIAVGVHDIGKAVLAVLLSKLFFPELYLAGTIAGCCCVTGHIFPFYLKFKGGKGFASYIGMIVALDWKAAIIMVILIVAITLITDYIVLATMTTVILFPVFTFFETGILGALIVSLSSAVIVIKHRKNIVRIIKGTEIGLRKASKGEYRSKKP